MKLLDVIKRAILEGKLDKELGITDCDVMQRFDKVMELLDKPIQLPRFNEVPRVDWESILRNAKPQTPVNSPFDWKNKVWCSTNNTIYDGLKKEEFEPMPPYEGEFKIIEYKGIKEILD